MKTEGKSPFIKSIIRSHTLKIKVPTFIGVVFVFLSALLFLLGSIAQTNTDYFSQVRRFAAVAPVFQEIATNYYFQSISFLIIAIVCFAIAYFFDSRQ